MLTPIDAKFVDFAWKDGASSLGESCEDECTPDQLRLLLSRGERVLVRLDAEDGIRGWAAFRVDNLPNMRVFHVTNLAARNGKFQEFFGELKDLARGLGCVRVRCSCKPLQAKIFKNKCGFTHVYETLEIEV
jgi:hypothetical protein